MCVCMMIWIIGVRPCERHLRHYPSLTRHTMPALVRDECPEVRLQLLNNLEYLSSSVRTPGKRTRNQSSHIKYFQCIDTFGVYLTHVSEVFRCLALHTVNIRRMQYYVLLKTRAGTRGGVQLVNFRVVFLVPQHFRFFDWAKQSAISRAGTP